jgi:hypothetical protein
VLVRGSGRFSTRSVHTDGCQKDLIVNGELLLRASKYWTWWTGEWQATIAAHNFDGRDNAVGPLELNSQA